MCLQWATADSAEKGLGIMEVGEDTDAVMAGEWVGASPFQCTVGLVGASRTDIAAYSFTTKLS